MRKSPQRVRPKTYSVAVYMVFAIAALELIMLVSILLAAGHGRAGKHHVP